MKILKVITYCMLFTVGFLSISFAASLELCRFHFEKGNYDEAIKTCGKVRGKSKDIMHSTYYYMGQSYYSKKEYEKAIRYFDLALQIKRDDASIYNARGSAYLAQNNLVRALGDFNKSIEFEPKESIYYRNRAKALIAANRNDLAITDLRSAWELQPGSPIGIYNKTVIFAQYIWLRSTAETLYTAFGVVIVSFGIIKICSVLWRRERKLFSCLFPLSEKKNALKTPAKNRENHRIENIAELAESISKSSLRLVQQQSLYQYALNYLDKKAVFFELPTGSGKSLIASAIAQYWIDKGFRVAILTETKQLQDQYAEDKKTKLFDLAKIYSHKGQADEAQAKSEKNANIDAYNNNKRAGVFSMNGFFNYRQLGMVYQPDIVLVDEAHKLAENVRTTKSLEMGSSELSFFCNQSLGIRQVVDELRKEASAASSNDDYYILPDKQREQAILDTIYKEAKLLITILEDRLCGALASIASILVELDKKNMLETPEGYIRFSDLNNQKYLHVLSTLENPAGNHWNKKQVCANGIKIADIDRILKLAWAIITDKSSSVCDCGIDLSIVCRTLPDNASSMDFIMRLNEYLKLYSEAPQYKQVGLAYNIKEGSLSLARITADIADGPITFIGSKQTIFLSGTILGAKKYAEELGIGNFDMSEISMIRGDEPIMYSGQRLLVPLNVCNLAKRVVDGNHISYDERMQQSIESINNLLMKHGKIAVLLASIEDMDAMEMNLKMKNCYRVGGKNKDGSIQSPDDQKRNIRAFLKDTTDGAVLLTVRWEGVDLKGIQAVILHRLPVGITARHKVLEQRIGENVFEEEIAPETLRKIVQGCGRVNRDNLMNGVGVYYLIDSRFPRFLKRNGDSVPMYISKALTDGERTGKGIDNIATECLNYIAEKKQYIDSLDEDKVWTHKLNLNEDIDIYDRIPFQVMNALPGKLEVTWNNEQTTLLYQGGDLLSTENRFGRATCWLRFYHEDSGFYVTTSNRFNIRPLAEISMTRPVRYLPVNVDVNPVYPSLKAVDIVLSKDNYTCPATEPQSYGIANYDISVSDKFDIIAIANKEAYPLLSHPLYDDLKDYLEGQFCMKLTGATHGRYFLTSDKIDMHVTITSVLTPDVFRNAVGTRRITKDKYGLRNIAYTYGNQSVSICLIRKKVLFGWISNLLLRQYTPKRYEEMEKFVGQLVMNVDKQVIYPLVENANA